MKKLARMLAKLETRKAEGYVDSGVKILIAVVIGALLLAGLYYLFNKVIMPTVGDKVNTLFNQTQTNSENYTIGAVS